MTTDTIAPLSFLAIAARIDAATDFLHMAKRDATLHLQQINPTDLSAGILEAEECASLIGRLTMLIESTIATEEFATRCSEHFDPEEATNE